MHEINKAYELPLTIPFYHSVHYIQFRYTPVNDFYQWKLEMNGKSQPLYR